MRKLLSSFTKYYKLLIPLVVVAVGLPAARPLFEARLPQATDTLPHYYTLVQLDYLMQQGIFYSRWFPYKASGFGEPFFQYYAPLAFYVAQIFKLSGLQTLTAMQLTIGLALVGGAWGMYLWVRDLLDDGPALIAAAAFVCSPYILYNTYFRGGFTEQFALMLIPFVLWAFRRLVISFRMRYLAIGAIMYAALLLTHSLTAFIFSPALLGYTLVLARRPTIPGLAEIPPLTPPFWGAKRFLHQGVREGSQLITGRPKGLLMLWLAIALGLGLSAFFWLPVIFERNAVLNDLVYATPALDYRNNFIPLNSLFSSILNPKTSPTVSIVTVALALIGLLQTRRVHYFPLVPTLERGNDYRGALRRASDITGSVDAKRPGMHSNAERWNERTSKVREIWFAAAVAIVYTMLTLSLSRSVWDALPFMRLFQFPYRFLSMAVIFWAFLAAVGMQAIVDEARKRNAAHRIPIMFAIYGLTLALLLGQTRVLSRVVYYPPLPDVDMKFIMQKEREAAPIIGEYNSIYVPVAVKQQPPFKLLARDGPERLDVDSLPPAASVLEADYNPLRYSLTISSPTSFTARFNTYYFPGWAAQLDGQSIPISPTDPHGAISVNVPAGERHLAVWFGTTPVRRVATALSLGSLLFLGYLFASQRPPRDKSQG